MRERGYRKGPSHTGWERRDMLAIVQLEASQSEGSSTYRLTMGVFMPLMASVVGLLIRLL
jgi:hypothetical protein